MVESLYIGGASGRMLLHHMLRSDGGGVRTVDLDGTVDVPRDANAQASAPIKVLVIDDSPTVLELVRRTLEQQGKYAVVLARDGVEGLEQFSREHPDCVIVDVMMPAMDGFQFTRVLRGDLRSSRTPLIILTALSGPDKRLTGILSGADEYLIKPFKPQDLCATIERVLALTPEQREQRLIQLADGGSE
jgi:DNA-binding response OmpR family regulator